MNYNAVAYHVQENLILKDLRKIFNESQLIKRELSYLLYKIDKHSYIYLKDYGSVIFINCTTKVIANTLSKLGNYSVNDSFPMEVYEIIVEEDNIIVDFELIKIPYLDDDMAHIIMLNLAQSVVLMYYVERTSDLHDKTLVYSAQLEESGTFKLTKKNMLKFIGKTMNLKNNIAEKLFVFDTPDLAWNNKELSLLDDQLKRELDIERRSQSIEKSLGVIKENLDLFNGILQHKYSNMLEWIIIILILFEVIQVIIENII